jgi:PIN domain nuclease of toxin-antitoxin system
LKRSLGKLTAPPDFVAAMSSAGVQPLAVTIEHAAAVEGLPWHHRDPFDRMLVAQAGAERAAIVSRDPAFRPYAVQIIW